MLQVEVTVFKSKSEFLLKMNVVNCEWKPVESVLIWLIWVCENCNHSVRVSAWQQNTAWPTHTHRQRSREWILFSQPHNTCFILQNNVESISVVWIFETKCCDKMKKINFSETWNNLKSRFNWSPRLELPEWRWAKNFDWISRTHYEVNSWT